MRVVVMGAGRVGGAIAEDLARDDGCHVTVADVVREAAERVAGRVRVRTIAADLSDPAVLKALAEEHDLVLGALPSHLGFAMLRAAIEAGTNVVDISFFEEDPEPLDAEARARGVVAVVDAGVSPGLSNLLLGDVQRRAESVERFVCYVGGLPEARTGLFEYKAPFAPSDVIELYTRPARYREGGEPRTAPALSDLTPFDFPDVGVLEAFLTDGLRTLLREESVPEMREMTLRYPGHAAKVGLLRDLGLFDREAIQVGEVSVVPRDLAAALLFPLWQFGPGERDLTVLRVEVDAVMEGRRRRLLYDLLDRYDDETDTSSMARTTGYTATAIARLVAGGTYARAGVAAPEAVGREAGCTERVLADLAARNVLVSVREV